MSHAIERVWAANGLAARALAPLSWLFAAATGVRNALYDLGVFRSERLPIPAISVGNLSVGGTGKTPVAAWVAQQLLALGASPAIVMRGYGADEPLVHARLNPAVPVIVNADRVAGAREAAARGATVAVLDDAFQHRRARREVDLVLVAAEQGAATRLLPAGPLREGRGALRRASLLVVTRKSATLAEAEAVAARWTAFAAAPPSCVIALVPGALHDARDPQAATLPREVMKGKRVLAISAVGAPSAFTAQLTTLGATVTQATFPDHHAFDARDAAALAARAETVDFAVCTLKDAVKLGPLWPRVAGPLWYLSQAVVVERGAAPLHEALHRLVRGIRP
ncbi:MAG: tetraacyldisaccharide 4'-kinase [Gemmatimonas sp.]|nr:tetraacyldisaccharide 4'-kinase [Gemmatimonas sp.]